jgi:hypothetical protein
MMKGLLIGVVLGGLAAAVALKALDRGGEEPAGGESAFGASGEPAAGDVGGLRKAVDDEKAAVEALRKGLESGRKELASLESVPGEGPAVTAKKASWKEIAPAIAKAMKLMGARPGGVGEEGEDEPVDRESMEKAMMQMYGLLTQIATERGLGMNEAMLCPEGFPALIQEMIAVGDPPATPDQLLAMQGLAEEHRAAFDAFMKSRGLGTSLEDRLAMTDLAARYKDGMERVLSPEQYKQTQAMDMFGMGMGSTHWTSGSRETVAQELSKSWAKALKLTETQAQSLGPIVADYMTACEGIPNSNPSEMASSEKRRLEAQIAAQKRIAGSIGLTEEQAQALKKWSTTYGFWIGEPQPVAPEETEVE